MQSSNGQHAPEIPHDPAKADSVSTGNRSRDRLFASRRQVSFILIGAVLSLFLFVEEVVHYAVSTDLGELDHAQAFLLVHPQCREAGSKFILSCPLPGYNSTLLQCDGEACNARDANFPVPTEEIRAKARAQYRADRIASLKIEEPYGKNDPEWQQRAIDLKTNRESLPWRLDINKRPARLEEALRIVDERSLLISQQIAQQYMDEHAK